jgi:hypothetical protein
MGCINHESARKQYPGSLGNAMPNANVSPDIVNYPQPANFNWPTAGGIAQVSWMTNLLPYIEQDALFRNIDMTRDVSNDARSVNSNGFVAQQRISLYRCPSDTTPTIIGERRRGPKPPPAAIPPSYGGEQYAVTSYKGVAGSNWAWGNFATTADPNFVSDPSLRNNGNAIGNGNGVLFGGYLGTVPSNMQTSNLPGVPCNTLVASIKDGLSNTFMVGESVGAFTTSNWWYSFYGSVGTVAIPLNAPPVCAAAAGVPIRKGYELCRDDWYNNYGFTSDHSVGANFAAADGSVRFVANTIDLGVYRALGGISDGLTAAMPD